MKMLYIKNEFRKLFESLRAKGNWEYFFEKIVREYNKSERFYHTFEDHIYFCLKELEKFPVDMIEDIDALKMALILHDAVMDFKRTDNEEKSAEFALELLEEMKISRQFAVKVANLILATKHNVMSKNNDAKIIVDIDLAIFGQDWETFDRYDGNIRRENYFVPEDIFKERRSIILQRFLDRKPIFVTSYFQRKYEAKAKENLSRAIDKLNT